MARLLSLAALACSALIIGLATNASLCPCQEHLQASGAQQAVGVQARAVSKDNGKPDADQDQPKDLHIYLLIGQSNMAGRAKLPDDADQVLKNCYLLNDKNQWEPAQGALNRYSTIRKGLGMQKLGPGLSFAKTMLAQNPDIKIGLVVNARGGSKIDQWDAKTKYYTEAIKRTKAAMKSGTVKGVLWHQGESDMKAPEGYLDKLQALIKRLRNDFEDDALPFIAGQINKGPAINDQIAQLPKKVKATAFVRSEGLTCTDRWHFDTASQIKLGERYAQQMIALHKAEAENEKDD